MDGEVNERFLTIKEAAELLQFSESTVRRWIDEGLLPAFRMGRWGHHRIALSQILKLTQT
jgi:excisionase family DNA binding protein